MRDLDCFFAGAAAIAPEAVDGIPRSRRAGGRLVTRNAGELRRVPGLDVMEPK